MTGGSTPGSKKCKSCQRKISSAGRDAAIFFYHPYQRIPGESWIYSSDGKAIAIPCISDVT